MFQRIRSYCYAFKSTTVIHTRWVSYTLEQLAVFCIIVLLMLPIVAAIWLLWGLGGFGAVLLASVPFFLTYYVTVQLRKDGMPLLDWLINEKDYLQMPDEFEPLTFEPVEEGEMEIHWRKGEKE